MKIYLYLSLTTALFLAMLGGCVSLKKEYPEKRYYVLDVKREVSAGLPLNGTVLKVRKFASSPINDANEFVYRNSGNSYETDFYNRFFIPISLILTGETREWLKDAAIFGQIAPPFSHLEETHILEGSLVSIHGDYRGETPKAVLEVQFILLEDKPSGFKKVFSSDYRKEIEIDDNSPSSLVDGWNKALLSIMESLESDITSSNLVLN